MFISLLKKGILEFLIQHMKLSEIVSKREVPVLANSESHTQSDPRIQQNDRHSRLEN